MTTSSPAGSVPAGSVPAGSALTFLGAAGSVTGSAFLLEPASRGEVNRGGDATPGGAGGQGGRVLVDCGLFQGQRALRRLNWERRIPDPASLDDVVVTHCHLDHCGYLPALVRQGYRGPVHATAGTAALGSIVLRDSARLQQEDAASARLGGWSRHDPPLPLYTEADAEDAIALWSPAAYGSVVAGAGGARMTLSRAGHVLGSASVLVEHASARVLFSGDLGRPTHPVLKPRERPPLATTVVVESTYGDRRHPDEAGHEVLADAVRRTVTRGGSVVIPAFAVDRTELVLQALITMREAGEIPDVPIHVDSPMALAALDVYAGADAGHELLPGAAERLAALPGVHPARSAQESRELNSPRRPCIIVSSSGMASGGRVVHHLAGLLPHPRNTVVLTGYQAVGTRGRDLAEGAPAVKIHGRYVPVRAEVVVDDAFSVHADSDEVMSWLGELPEAPETVYVVHGEEAASAALARRVTDELGWVAVVPRLGERVLV